MSSNVLCTVCGMPEDYPHHQPVSQREPYQSCIPHGWLMTDDDRDLCSFCVAEEAKATPVAPVISAEVSEIAGRDTDDSTIRADSVDSRDSIAP